MKPFHRIDWAQVKATLDWTRKMAHAERENGSEKRAAEYDETAAELQGALDYRGEAQYDR